MAHTAIRQTSLGPAAVVAEIELVEVGLQVLVAHQCGNRVRYENSWKGRAVLDGRLTGHERQQSRNFCGRLCRTVLSSRASIATDLC